MTSLVERDLMHNLFMFGSVVPLDKVTKYGLKIFTTHECFMPLVKKMTTVATDQAGLKTFKLKEEYLTMFDPFYHAGEKQITL